MRIEPFKRAHIDNLLFQPEQEYLQEWVTGENVAAYERGYSFALVNDAGATLACAGLIELWPGRAHAWCLFSSHVGGIGTLAATRAIRRAFGITPYARIEAEVDRNFPAGHRWMRMLGFVNETPQGMQSFIEGRTFDLYARVK